MSAGGRGEGREGGARAGGEGGKFVASLCRGGIHSACPHLLLSCCALCPAVARRDYVSCYAVLCCAVLPQATGSPRPTRASSGTSSGRWSHTTRWGGGPTERVQRWPGVTGVACAGTDQSRNYSWFDGAAQGQPPKSCCTQPCVVTTVPCGGVSCAVLRRAVFSGGPTWTRAGPATPSGATCRRRRAPSCR